MKSSSRSRSKQAVTYMEVYGANRVLYRVTASNTTAIKNFLSFMVFSCKTSALEKPPKFMPFPTAWKKPSALSMT